MTTSPRSQPRPTATETTCSSTSTGSASASAASRRSATPRSPLPRGEVTALDRRQRRRQVDAGRAASSGVHRPDAGTIALRRRAGRLPLARGRSRAGIETVHQNLALVEDLTVWQNLFLGREKTRVVGPLRLLDRRGDARARPLDMVARAGRQRARRSHPRVRRLSGGQRQAVAHLPRRRMGPRIVIMDEPTAALGVQETARVEELILGLRDAGLAVLLISHNFDQVMRLADQRLGDARRAHRRRPPHRRDDRRGARRAGHRAPRSTASSRRPHASRSTGVTTHREPARRACPGLGRRLDRRPRPSMRSRRPTKPRAST